MKFKMIKEALAMVEGMAPVQLWFFVCSSRAKNALVVAAYIGKDQAQREARKIGGCARIGRVEGETAVTL